MVIFNEKIKKGGARTSLALFVIYAFLIIAVILAGLAYYFYQKENVKDRIYEDLALISDFKSNQIYYWYNECLLDAYTIFNNKTLIREINKDIILNKQNKVNPDIEKYFKSFSSLQGYYDILIFNNNYDVICSVNNTSEKLNKEGIDYFNKSVTHRNPVISKIYRCNKCAEIHLDISIPLFYGNILIGGIILRVNPENYLFPLIQSWPTKSRTAETLLITVDSNYVVYLNELRHRKETSLKLKFKIDSSNYKIPAVQAALGTMGLFEGIDYRGINVLSNIKRIRDTDWYMIAKQDMDEIMEPLFSQAVNIGLVTGSFLIAITFLFGWIITSQKKSLRIIELEEEKKHQALIKHFDYLVKYSNDVYFLSDKYFKIIEINERALKTYWYSREELIGMNIIDLRSPLTKKNFVRDVGALSLTGETIYETVHRKKDGSEFYIEASVRKIFINDDTYYQFILRDITDRKKAELKLKELSLRNEAILSSVPDIIMEVNTNRIYTYANNAGIEFFGDDVVGKEASRYFCEDQQTYEIVQPLFSGDENYIYVESWQRRKDGQKRLLAWWCRSMKDDNGNVIGILFSAQDITERKEAEEKIKNINRELEQKVAERTKELESFSYSVSHDLRAPLRGIDGFSLALYEDYYDKLDDKGKEYINRIRNAAKKMDELIDNMLKLSRVIRYELKAENVNLSALVRDILSSYGDNEKNRKTEFKIEDNVNAFADPYLIKIAIENILHNSWKFTSKNELTRIEFGLTKKDSDNVYFIKDNGAGFDMNYYNKLFSPFQRLHSNKEFPGTGIGLATVRRIINMHNGKIWAESVLGRETVFYFTLNKNL